MAYNKEDHMKRLPTVRIKRIVLDDFKSVEHGEIVFNCGRKFVPEGTESDILGLYGQNGSGKTSLIEALVIVKAALSSEPIPMIYSKCIAIDKPFASILTVFDLQYPNGTRREATYSFSIKKEHTNEEEKVRHFNDLGLDQLVAAGVELDQAEMNKYFFTDKIVVFDEKLSLDWEGSSKRTLLIDTACTDYPFSPNTKRKEMVGNKRKTLIELEVNKQLWSAQSKSFVFSEVLIDTMKENSLDPIFPELLVELSMFAKNFLYVFDNSYSKIVETNVGLFIPTIGGFYLLDMNEPELVIQTEYEEKKRVIQNVSKVLEQIVPGLSIDFVPITNALNEKGQAAISATLISRRNGREIPFRYESDGIKKLTSILSAYIFAYYQKSVTVAIDEFDAEIFEYMLGEMLQVLEESGKGQFIFTSHNLRPLEVINKKFLYFTTTNPSNRYIRLKGIAETNNLRDTYYRELIVNEQDECIYNRTKKTKLASALQLVGGQWYGEEA